MATWGLAAALLLSFGLSIGVAGAALAGWRPRLARTVLGTAIAISFFLLEFGIVFGWPTWLLRLSVFELYVTPLVSGVWWPGLAALILSTVGFVLAAATLERRGLGPTSKPIDQKPLPATKHAISHGNQRNEPHQPARTHHRPVRSPSASGSLP